MQKLDETNDAKHIYKQYNVKNAIIMLNYADNDKSRTTIYICWHKAGYNEIFKDHSQTLDI